MFHRSGGTLLFHKKLMQAFNFDLGLCLPLVNQGFTENFTFSDMDISGNWACTWIIDLGGIIHGS